MVIEAEVSSLSVLLGLGICSPESDLRSVAKGFFSDIDIPQVGAVLDGIVSVLLSKPLLA